MGALLLCILKIFCNSNGWVADSIRPLFKIKVGICVIDVVEGTAMDALSSMQGFLRSRPCKFKSLEQAIEWCVRSGQVCFWFFLQELQQKTGAYDKTFSPRKWIFFIYLENDNPHGK